MICYRVKIVIAAKKLRVDQWREGLESLALIRSRPSQTNKAHCLLFKVLTEALDVSKVETQVSYYNLLQTLRPATSI